MSSKNGIFVLFILIASFSSSSATFEWLSDLFGFGSSSHYGPGFGGPGSLFGFGGNRRPRPGTALGTIHGSGYVGEGSGLVGGLGGSNYLGGGWSGPGNSYYQNSGGLLGNLGLFRGGYNGQLQHRFGRGGIKAGYHKLK